MTFQAKITSKGQITLPSELRKILQLHDGDAVEFYFDHAGRVCMRARRPGSDAFLRSLPPRRRASAFATDDDAIAAAVLAKDRRSRKGRA